MGAAIVIPARYGSSRFPGKPLHEIAGVSMLERVWRIAKAVKGATRVVIATEDQRIFDFAKSFGAEAVMTPETCENGTERMHAAVKNANIREDILVNLQGDAPITPPWVLEAMIEAMEKDKSVEIVTPGVKLTDAALEAFRKQKELSPASGTTIVMDKDNNALYFSKNILPYMRKTGVAPVYRHVGLYGYRIKGLERYISLSPSPLEQAEGLEQLRPLEHGMKIKVVVVDYKNRTHGSVDSPEDVKVIEDIIAREGELI